MSQKLILLLVIGLFIVSSSLELSAQSTPVLSQQENVDKEKTARALKTPETVQNIVSKNPIRQLKVTLQDEIKGMKIQLTNLKKVSKPSAIINTRIKHLEKQLVVKEKLRAAQVIKSK